MGGHSTREGHETVFQLHLRCSARLDPLEEILIILGNTRTFLQITMRDANLSKDGAKHLIGAAKVQAIDSLEREKQHRPPVHPLAAQRSILGDLQSLKHRLTVPADVKKVGQHAHAHGFPKPAGAGDQSNFRCLFLQQVSNETRLVHIVIVVLPDLRKVRNPDRDLQISHARGPLPITQI